MSREKELSGNLMEQRNQGFVRQTTSPQLSVPALLLRDFPPQKHAKCNQTCPGITTHRSILGGELLEEKLAPRTKPTFRNGKNPPGVCKRRCADHAEQHEKRTPEENKSQLFCSTVCAVYDREANASQAQGAGCGPEGGPRCRRVQGIHLFDDSKLNNSAVRFQHT